MDSRLTQPPGYGSGWLSSQAWRIETPRMATESNSLHPRAAPASFQDITYPVEGVESFLSFGRLGTGVAHLVRHPAVFRPQGVSAEHSLPPIRHLGPAGDGHERKVLGGASDQRLDLLPRGTGAVIPFREPCVHGIQGTPGLSVCRQFQVGRTRGRQEYRGCQSIP